MKFLTILTAVVALVFTAVTPARAEITELEILFIKADLDGDLKLNKAEILLVSLNQLQQSDSDHDSVLEKNEVGDLASDPEFSDNDKNKDGALSIEEIIEEKLADFKAADTNNDEFLSFEEITIFYKAN